MPTGIEDMLVRLRELAPDPLIAAASDLFLIYALNVRSKTCTNARALAVAMVPFGRTANRSSARRVRFNKNARTVLDRSSRLSIRADVRSGHAHEQLYSQSAVSFASETRHCSRAM
jgi:hypothetical protein